MKVSGKKPIEMKDAMKNIKEGCSIVTYNGSSGRADGIHSWLLSREQTIELGNLIKKTVEAGKPSRATDFGGGIGQYIITIRDAKSAATHRIITYINGYLVYNLPRKVFKTDVSALEKWLAATRKGAVPIKKKKR